MSANGRNYDCEWERDSKSRLEEKAKMAVTTTTSGMRMMIMMILMIIMPTNGKNSTS